MVDLANPFIFGRVEYESNPTLYMTQRVKDWLAAKPQLFEGPRGSGKSSILKCLTWSTAWKLGTVELHGSPDVVRSLTRAVKHLAVEHRVEEMDVDYWDRWRQKFAEDTAQKFFGTYLDLIFLDLFLHALAAIRRTSASLFTSYEAERAVVQELVAIAFPRGENRLPGHLKCFSRLREIVAQTHLGLREQVFSGRDPEAILAAYSVIAPGALLQCFASSLTEQFHEVSNWSIMPMLDDVNQLFPWQARVLNTIIVRSRSPLAFKITSVSALYRTRDALPSSRALVEHDVQTVSLPGGSSPSDYFRRLANGVCQVRIAKYRDEDHAREFDLNRVLGKFELETALIEKLRDSENPACHDLLRDMERIKERRVTATWLKTKQIRPIRELGENDGLLPKRVRHRYNESSYLRKWSHAAGVALCREYNLDFPYHGLDVVLHLSCGSIRELLRIMSALWDEIGLQTDGFASQTPVGRNVQTRAIRAASIAAFSAIGARQAFPQANLAEICSRLGEFFAECQSYPYILATPETASICISSRELDSEITDIVDQAVMAGVMLKKEDKGVTGIGLHPILAPKFEIAYRNPFYYPQSVTINRLRAFFKGSKSEYEHAVREILEERVPASEPRQKKLF